jgi:hypothetical protein
MRDEHQFSATINNFTIQGLQKATAPLWAFCRPWMVKLLIVAEN